MEKHIPVHFSVKISLQIKIMPCDRHLIYDKVNQTLGNLHQKYSDYKTICAVNAVVEVKLNGVKVHVQVHDKKRNVLTVDAKLRIRNMKELENANKFFENCEVSLASLVDDHENDLPECNDCYIVDQ